MHLEYWADGRVELGVHQGDVLAGRDRRRAHLRPGLDFAGGVDDRVDIARAAQEERILGDRVPFARDGVFQRTHAVDRHNVADAGLVVGTHGLRQRPIGDGDKSHARDRGEDVERDTTPHVPGTDQADTDRVALSFALLECFVDDDHLNAPSPTFPNGRTVASRGRRRR